VNSRFILLPLSLMLTTFAKAQQKQRSLVQDTSLMVSAGTILNNVLPAKNTFHYSEFLPGKVYFRDGRIAEANMNYNRIMDEMQFINRTGDTLALSDEPTIRVICIEKDSFYFDRGYVLLVETNDAVKLGVKHGLKLGDKRKPTGYDMMSSTSSVTSLRSLLDGRRLYNLEVKEQTLISTFTQYYFGDKFNRFIPATKKNLLSMFPQYANPIKKFCKSNGIDFSKKEGLKTVVSFISDSCR
jgi:hypothetical protein